MKRRIISLVMVAMFIIILAVTLTGCDDVPQEFNDPQVLSPGISNFENIKGEDILFFDRNTQIVYYLFSTAQYPNTHGAMGYGYMAPYISENGNYCRYIDGKIVEIQK